MSDVSKNATNKTLLVAKWEFMRNFKWKQELIGYLIMLGIYASIFAVQLWDASSQQKEIVLGVVGDLNVELDDSFSTVSLPADLSTAEIFKALEAQTLDGALQERETGDFSLFAPQQSKWHQSLEQSLSEQYQTSALQALNLSKTQLDNLLEPIAFKLISDAEEAKSDTQFLGMFAAILSAVAVFTSFALCMTSVTQEKQQRITEQLLTCLSHQQWVDGKTLGLYLSSLKSLFTTALFATVIMVAIAAFSGTPSLLAGVSFVMILQVLVFCTLGILFWNYVFVGFSATIDDPNHSGKTGIMMLPMVPVMLAFFVTDDPNGQVATVLSMFPLTSISFMPMRIAAMDVPLWQIASSFVLMLVGIYYVRLFASRIFRANITLFGKEPSWSDIWRNMIKG